MGVNQFERDKDGIVEQFVDFSEFMRRRSTRTLGLFFVLVKSDDDADAGRSTRIPGNDLCSEYVDRTNRDFIDAGGPFSGDCEREASAIARIIEEQNL